MVYHSVCDHVSKSQKLHIASYALCTPSSPSADEGRRWGFLLKPQKVPYEEFVQLVFMCILCVEYTYVHKIENYVYFSFGF